MFYCVQALYKHLPQQRKLPEAAIAKAARLLSLEANKALVQAELAEETGKVITRKDLTNVASRSKQGVSRNSLTTFVDTLKDKYGIFSVSYIWVFVMLNKMLR